MLKIKNIMIIKSFSIENSSHVYTALYIKCRRRPQALYIGIYYAVYVFVCKYSKLIFTDV